MCSMTLAKTSHIIFVTFWNTNENFNATNCNDSTEFLSAPASISFSSSIQDRTGGILPSSPLLLSKISSKNLPIVLACVVPAETDRAAWWRISTRLRPSIWRASTPTTISNAQSFIVPLNAQTNSTPCVISYGIVLLSVLWWIILHTTCSAEFPSTGTDVVVVDSTWAELPEPS